MSLRNQLVGALLVGALAACGGGNSAQSSSASAGPSSAGGAMQGGPMQAQATMPPGLNCGAVQSVWVNQRSHTYHEPSDPLYGRTRHGQYMCPSAAVAAGYHKASGKHRHYGGMVSAPTATP